MANFSDYMENLIINHFLRNTSYTPVATLHIALFTGTAGAALEANNPTTEVSTSGTAYARKAVAFTAPSGGATENSAEIAWDAATASWGTVTHLAIVDHATNTNWGTNVNVLMWGELTDPKTVEASDIFKILSGDLDITVQ
jgi:hypothetical protein